MSNGKDMFHPLWVLAGLAAMILLGAGGVRPPPLSPGEEEALGRALAHVERIAVRPHPCGTPDNERVRQYLVDTLRSLGLEVEVQSTTAFAPEDGASATLHNVLARLPGTGGEGAKSVLVASHYDTKPAAPGAGDATAAVASMLETARQLAAGPRPKNPVIFLVTDCEEDGLMGAHAFVDEHPWARTVGIALNFEARGVTGPSLLFETSPDNAAMVRELASLVPHPRGTSLAYEVYKHLPNDTDFTVFKAAGFPGLNFAFHDGWQFYHTPFDDPRHLDHRSVQHHLGTMRALVTRFANVDLPLTSPGDSVYFDLAGWTFLVYPASWIQPLALAAAILALLVMGIGSRTGAIDPRGVLMSAGLGLLAILVARFVGLVLPPAIADLHASRGIPGDVLRSGAYGCFFAATAFTVVTFLMTVGGSRARGLEGATGALLLWTLLQLAIAHKLPGGSYLFTGPTLALAAALAIAFRRGALPATRGQHLATFALTAPCVTLLTSTTILVFVSMGNSRIGAPLVGIVVCLTTLLSLLFLTPVTSSRPRLMPGIGLAAMLATFAHAAWVTRYSPDYPRAENFHYMVDARGRLAQWSTMGPEGDIERARAAVARFLTQVTKPGTVPPLGIPCKALPLPGPTVESKETARGASSRNIRLLVKSPRGAREVSLCFPDTEVKLLTVQGKLFPGSPSTSWHHHFALPPEGLQLEIETGSLEPVELLVADWTSELPGSDVGIPPRTPLSMPGRFGDRTVVLDSFPL